VDKIIKYQLTVSGFSKIDTLFLKLIVSIGIVAQSKIKLFSNPRININHTFDVLSVKIREMLTPVVSFSLGVIANSKLLLKNTATITNVFDFYFNIKEKIRLSVSVLLTSTIVANSIVGRFYILGFYDPKTIGSLDSQTLGSMDLEI
jgi:hypothetical protein